MCQANSSSNSVSMNMTLRGFASIPHFLLLFAYRINLLLIIYSHPAGNWPSLSILEKNSIFSKISNRSWTKKFRSIFSSYFFIRNQLTPTCTCVRPDSVYTQPVKLYLGHFQASLASRRRELERDLAWFTRPITERKCSKPMYIKEKINGRNYGATAPTSESRSLLWIFQ